MWPDECRYSLFQSDGHISERAANKEQHPSHQVPSAQACGGQHDDLELLQPVRSKFSNFSINLIFPSSLLVGAYSKMTRP